MRASVENPPNNCQKKGKNQLYILYYFIYFLNFSDQ